MNVNERILNQHVEYEPQAYVYAFTIELEICAAAMWCFVNHLNAYVRKCSRKMIITDKSCLSCSILPRNWSDRFVDTDLLFFHLPLHRYLSVFAYQAIHAYNINPSRFLPVDDELALSNLLFFPLRTLVGDDKEKNEWLYLLCDQSGYYEVLSNIWLRNGQQLTIQAKTYAKSAFSSSMHDADLYLLQVTSSPKSLSLTLSTIILVDRLFHRSKYVCPFIA